MRCSSRWGSRPRRLGDYFGRIIEFARAARWGKRPLDRAAAVELAGVSSDVRTPGAQAVAGRGRNARVRKRTATAVSSGSCWMER